MVDSNGGVPRGLDRGLLLGIGLLVLLIVGSELLSFYNVRQLQTDADSVTHTYQVLDTLDEILSLATDAETGQRGYVITDDRDYLKPYNAAIVAIQGKLNELERLTRDNPDQQARVPELRQRVEARLSTLKENLELRENEGFEAAQRRIRSNQGKEEMDAVRVVVNEMEDVERQLLQKRAENSKLEYRTNVVSGIVTAWLGVLAVAAFAWMLSRYLAARAAAAASLWEQRERYRTTLASIGDGVVTTDERGRVKFMNSVAESLTGWREAEAVDAPLASVMRLINEDTREPAANPVDRVLAEGVVVGLANHTLLIRKDGVEIPIDDSAAPIRDQEQKMTGCVLVFRDIIERKQAEAESARLNEELRLANDRKNEFLATLAHELRNPLAPIRNSLELMQLSEHDVDVRQECRTIIERQVIQMVRLIDDLLDISRISRGKIELRKEHVDLQTIIAAALEGSKPLIESQRHQLHIQLPSEPIMVHADPTRIAQVVLNLLNNAAKYTDPGGQIWLVVERTPDTVVIRVRDNGIGIPPEMLNHIFEMFTQVDRSVERSHGGLGIGLTLVRRMVEMHGGTTEAHSEGEHQGSEFVIRLPLAAEVSATDTGALPVPQKTGKAETKWRILAVDDNRDAVDTLAIMLRLKGHEVQTAYDGLEAIDVAARFRPDIVLLDIGLPQLNGYEVARRLRQLPNGDRMKLIAVTGWGQDEDRRRSQEAGFDFHLVKPVDPAALRRLFTEAESGG